MGLVTGLPHFFPKLRGEKSAPGVEDMTCDSRGRTMSVDLRCTKGPTWGLGQVEGKKEGQAGGERSGLDTVSGISQGAGEPTQVAACRSGGVPGRHEARQVS